MAGGDVEVHLFGGLAGRYGARSAFEASARSFAVDDMTRIGDVLAALGIGPEDVSHVFLNGEYSALRRRVHPGDRLGVFGRDMALLYRQYFPVIEDRA
jgi:Mut7-C ubiquitin